MQNGHQVAIGRDTYLLSQFFDIKTLGSTVAGGPPTFLFQKPAKVFVCTKQWDKNHIKQLLQSAIAQHLPNTTANVVFA